MMGMNIHEVLLQLVRFGEEFETALTAILCGSGHEVRGHMLLKGLVLLCTGKLGPTVGAGQGATRGWALGVADSTILTRENAYEVAAASKQTSQTPCLLQV